MITVLGHEHLLDGRRIIIRRLSPGVVGRGEVREPFRRVVQLIVESTSLTEQVGRAEKDREKYRRSISRRLNAGTFAGCFSEAGGV